MKPLSILALAYGLLLVVYGVVGGMFNGMNSRFFDQAWAQSLEEQGMSLEQWSLHWNVTCALFMFFGVFSILVGIGIWRSSRTALAVWFLLIVCVLLVQSILFAFNPLPFAFQEVSIIDIGFQVGVLALSVFLFGRIGKERKVMSA